MNRKLIFLFSFYLLQFPSMATAQISIDQSILNFTNFQTKAQCLKNENRICSKNIDKFLEDEKESRAGIIHSRAEHCYKIPDLNRSKKEKATADLSLNQFIKIHQKDIPVSEFSYSTIHSCLNGSQQIQSQKNKISKFYYYQKRLNLGMQNVIEQRIKIKQVLAEDLPNCPSKELFKSASESCDQLKSCKSNFTKNDFLTKAKSDSKLFFELKNNLKIVEKNCKSETDCEKKKESLVLSIKSLTDMNPWMLSSQFRKENDPAFEKKIINYLQNYDKDLKTIEENLNEAANCTHLKKDCDIDKIHEIISMTPDVADSYTQNPESNEVIRYQMMNQCLEEATLDRNKTGSIMKETYWNLGQLAATMGLSGIGQLSKTAGQALWSRRAQLLSEAANISVDTISTSQSLKETFETCFQQGQILVNSKSSEKLRCENNNIFLNPRDSEQQSCLLSAGISLASTLGLGLSVSTSTLNKNLITDRRTSANRLIEFEKRQNEFTKVEPLKFSENEKVQARAMGTETKNIKVYGKTNIENKTSYHSTFPVKGSDGILYRKTQEIQFDDISGGINASYQAGRELFEKIAQEKSGKAHFAFIDVASLGAVNKTFKAGDAAGDKYIKAVADKVLEHGEGKVTLARLGGDEFGLIIDEADPQKVKQILKNIHDGLRKDFAGDAKQIFREEKIVRAEEFKKQKALLESENSGPLTEQQLAQLREPIDTLAKIQQPDISIGSTQIGAADSLESLLFRSEKQAKEMKIDTVLMFGRSAEKYGSKEIPRSKPLPNYQSEIALPEISSSWRTVGNQSPSANLSSLTDLATYRLGEVYRFKDLSLAKYSDANGKDFYKIEKYITDPNTKLKTRVEYEIPARGSTGLLDGTHPESQNFILQHFNSQENSVLIMPKLKSLKYLNYFEDGTKAGDILLEAAAESMKKNMRSSDLTFKLPGADFLWSTQELPKDQLEKVTQRINEDILKNEKVQTVLRNEMKSLQSRLKIAESSKTNEDVEKIKNQISELKNLRPQLSFESITKKEVNQNSSLKDYIKLLDQKFSD